MSDVVFSTHSKNFGTTGVNIFGTVSSSYEITDIVVTNGTGTQLFVQFFEVAAASVTIGTTVPALEIALSGTGSFDKSFAYPWVVPLLSVFATTTAGGSASASNPYSVTIFVQ